MLPNEKWGKKKKKRTFGLHLHLRTAIYLKFPTIAAIRRQEYCVPYIGEYSCLLFPFPSLCSGTCIRVVSTTYKPPHATKV